MFTEIFLIFILGVIIGSFLNTVIWRSKSGKSIFKGRSQCIHCDRRILARDLLPFISFILLRGKCRYCRKKISWQYPAVELVTALFFVLIWIIHRNFYPLTPTCPTSICGLIAIPFLFFIASVLIISFVLDLRYMILPTGILLVSSVVALVFNYFLGVNILMLLSGAGLGFLFFVLQYIISKGKWLGGGDIYLGLFMGASLGFPAIFYAIGLAYILGAIAALVLLVSKKVTLKDRLPLGTFLSIASFIILLIAPMLHKILNF